MDWLSAVTPPRLPPLRWCLLPSYVSRDTSALAVFTRCAREASLRRYAAVAGHVPGTPSGRGTFPWSTFRAHGPAHLANAGVVGAALPPTTPGARGHFPAPFCPRAL